MGHLVLPGIDQSVTREYNRWMLVFDFPDVSPRAIARAAVSIQFGLDAVLNHYPFLKGWLGPAYNSCRSDMALRWNEYSPYPLKYQVYKNECCPYQTLCELQMPVSFWRVGDVCAAPAVFDLNECPPVFTLQATFLESGGLILCFAFHHSIADDWSISEFLVKLASAIRKGKELFKPPVYHAPCLSGYINPSSCEGFEDFPEWTIPEMLHDVYDMSIRREPAKLKNYIFRLPARVATGLRESLVKEHHEKQKLTVLESIKALIWVEIAQARYADLKAPKRQTRFYTDINTRWKLVPPLPRSYFGNMSARAVASQRVDGLIAPDKISRRGAIVSRAKLAELAMSIRESFQTIDDIYVRRRLTFLDRLRDPVEVNLTSEEGAQSCAVGIKFSSADIGANIDFGIPGAGSGAGDGRPRWVRKPWLRTSGTVRVLPRRKEKKACWEIQVCLEDWHIEALRTKLEDEWRVTTVEDDCTPDWLAYVPSDSSDSSDSEHHHSSM